MIIFIDTTFTDFNDPQLISVALVTEDGQTFYGERADFPHERCSAHVVQTVLPQLGQSPAASMRGVDLATACYAWLAQFRNQAPTIAYDYDGDRALLCRLLGFPPGWLGWKNIYADIEEPDRQRYFATTGETEHHALHEAQASRFAYQRKHHDGEPAMPPATGNPPRPG